MFRIAHVLGAVTLVCAAIAPSGAPADTIAGTRSDKLSQRSHTAHLRVFHGYAELTHQRTLENRGERHDQAVLFLDLPEGAVATSLRTLGSTADGPRWWTADLLEAEQAAARYRELTGIGGAYPKDPALLSWRQFGRLELQVFPVAPRGTKTLEYTLLLPTQYREGDDCVTLSGTGPDAVTAVTANTADSSDQLRVAGAAARQPASVSVVEGAEVEVCARRRNAPPLGGRLMIIRNTPHRVMSHFRIEAARALSHVPRGANVVVVLDASCSLEADDVKAELAAARAYLANFEDAHVQVLTFDRWVRRRHPDFVPTAVAMADLDVATVTCGNGSAFDRALAEADRLLAAAGKGARRVVLLTDLRGRSSLAPEQLRGALHQSGALLHIGAIQSGEPSLARVDEGPFASLPRETGGLLWDASASSSSDDEESMARTYEEWARPLRIDHFGITSAGIAREGMTIPEQLAEGESFEDFRIAAGPVDSVFVRGELWAEPVHLELSADAVESTRWSALVFGSPLFDKLEERDMLPLALHGHAVSPVTSLLAIEPGVRPSTEGLDAAEGVGFGSGGLGLAGSGSAGHGAARLPGEDPESFLRRRLDEARRTCGAEGAPLAVQLESTLREVVDVVRVVIADAARASRGSCIADAAWDFDLPDTFTFERRTWRIEL